MTVSELIELLREYPASLRVMVNGYEDGYDARPVIGADIRSGDVSEHRNT